MATTAPPPAAAMMIIEVPPPEEVVAEETSPKTGGLETVKPVAVKLVATLFTSTPDPPGEVIE